jgi:hypothetical protein
VVPRSITFRYKGRDIDPYKAGRQLKVSAVLTGKVLQRGETLNVQAELVDVRHQAQLWGERFVRRVSDILAVEDEIAGQITDKLRLKITGEDRDRLGRRYTENTEAYHLFLKGRYYWSKRTRPNLQKSVGAVRLGSRQRSLQRRTNVTPVSFFRNWSVAKLGGAAALFTLSEAALRERVRGGSQSGRIQ